MALKNDANFTKNDTKWYKNWLVLSKMTWEIWQIFTRALDKSQSWDFDGILLSKVKNVWT